MTAVARPRWWWALVCGATALGLVALILLTARALPRPASAAPPATDSADAGFARDMAVHHQQAVEMSFIVRDRTDDPAVRTLAYDVINTQANQRGMLLGLLDSWDLPVVSGDPPMAWAGHGAEHHPDDGALMPGMATDGQLAELREARGEAAEIVFLRLMTDHHRSGAAMAEEAVDLASDPVVVGLAQDMARAQRAELRLMADLLQDRGASPDA